MESSPAPNSSNPKGSAKMKFTAEEDSKLLELVAAQGAHNWPKIAESFPHRNARQCRERYKNYLAPDVSKKPFSDDEETLLRSLIEKHGKKWSYISQFFQNRTDVSLKNHWINIQRKDRRMEKRSMKNQQTDTFQMNTNPIQQPPLSIPNPQNFPNSLPSVTITNYLLQPSQTQSSQFQSQAPQTPQLIDSQLTQPMNHDLFWTNSETFIFDPYDMDSILPLQSSDIFNN